MSLIGQNPYNYPYKLIVDQDNRLHLWYGGHYKIRTGGEWKTILGGGWSDGRLAVDADGYAHVLRTVDNENALKLYYSTNRP